jgi:hypothetical protein
MKFDHISARTKARRHIVDVVGIAVVGGAVGDDGLEAGGRRRAASCWALKPPQEMPVS